ncbi:MAG TPA: hypothetical protein PLD82_01825 [Spirochaetota bacterium]|nr:hypothetical protein [Spirochaetota bacterium]
MGGLDDEAAKQEKIRNKARFNESIKKYKGDIDVIDKRIKLMEKDIRTKKDALNGYRHVIIANEYLKIIGLYCAMNDESVQIMNFKNENYLNEARKLIYQVLIHLEDVVTPHIDIPPNDLEDKLEAIAKLNPQRKLNLLNAIGFRIQQVVDAFGDNTKWKWSFVEIDGRYAVVTKNMIDYRVAIANNDPRKPYYVENLNLMRMVKEQLEKASRRYREKYEQTTKETEDIKKSIAFIAAMRRILILMGQSEEANKYKRIMELATNLMEENIKKKEAEKRAPAKKK